jgi:hypothetical protein
VTLDGLLSPLLNRAKKWKTATEGAGGEPPNKKRKTASCSGTQLEFYSRSDHFLVEEPFSSVYLKVMELRSLPEYLLENVLMCSYLFRFLSQIQFLAALWNKNDQRISEYAVHRL